MNRLAVPLVWLACAALPGEALASSGEWRWPVRGELLTAFRYGGAPYAGGQHRGTDVSSPVGSSVVAAAGGTVRFAGVAGSSGLVVSVRTDDARFDTSYLHLAAVAVGEGERVAVGQRLGAVGVSGRRSTAAPHLHFGVRVAGRRHGYRDPLDFLSPPAPVRDTPRGAPLPVLSPIRLGRAPRAVPISSRAPFARPAPAAPRASGALDLGWAVACAALILAAISIGARPSRSSIGRHAVLRHHADLLRQR